jgi:uncharacterized protein (TIGR03083 family)
MTTDHEAVRELLGAWAVDALTPEEGRTVSAHLADCELCAAEGAGLRTAVRDLDGPPFASAPAGPLVLSRALRARPGAPRTASHAAPYAAGVAGLRALLAELEERGRDAWGTRVVHDWNVHDTVAHLLAADEPLALRLGLHGPAPASDAVDGTPWRVAWAARTAEVLARERGRAPAATVAAWRNQASALLAAPEAHDPDLAGRATTLMGARLPVADHFLVRAFETWVHTDDIGRALDIPVPTPLTPHLWQLVRLAVRILDLALGSRPPAVALTVAGEGGEAEWILGSGAEPVAAELVLDPVDFCLLMGGRASPAGVARGISGSEEAAGHVLTRAASLAWL